MFHAVPQQPFTFHSQNHYRYTFIAMSQQEEDVKPSVRASATPSTPDQEEVGRKDPYDPKQIPSEASAWRDAAG
jgi:hypothetical protein